MRLSNFLLLSASLTYASAYATDGYVRMVDTGVAVGLSPDGSTVFGYNGRSGEDSQSTWMYDVATQTTTPFTICTDSDNGGQVMWLNDGGTAVGTLRDAEWAAPFIDDGMGGVIEDYPLNTACIWKDGNMVKLDHNRWTDPSTFVATDGTLPSPNNGFYAMRLSKDETTIVGYLKAFYYMLPVKWTLNDDGTYTSTMMERPAGSYFYMWVGASADCRRVIMNTSQTDGISYIWEDDKEPDLFYYEEDGVEISEPSLCALSPSGRYAIMRCYREGKRAYGVYDFDTESVKWIAVPVGAASTNWFAANVVTDRGDGFICDYNYQLHYFNTDLDINIPINSYIDAFGGDIADSGSMPGRSIVRMISDDGRTICGNTVRNSLENDGWVVRLPEASPLLFALTECQAMYSSVQSVLVKWAAPKLPEGMTVERYMLEIDNEEPIIAETAIGADGMMRTEAPCPAGEHTITLYCVAKDSNGKEWESVRQTMTVEISADTSLFFFEDLVDSDVDATALAYIYTHDTFAPLSPDDSAALSFRLDAGDFYDLTPFWYTCGFSNAEWNTYMESRWFDATEQTDGFYFTWHERNLPINDAQKVSATNKLMVEYTTDGENWNPLHVSDGESNAGKWNIRTVDLSALKGESFRLRFHAKGGGKYACEWRVDYYGILPDAAIYDAPEGLKVTEMTDETVKLAWKNNRGEYEVSYNYNSPMTFNNNLGNEGEPFYVACDYGTDKLKAFEGKYITAVATMLYEPPTAMQDYHTTVEAVVFDEQGTEISRGTLANDAPWYEEGTGTIMPIHHICLDSPVKIERGKTYRVAILITNYEPEMCPIWYYSASDDYIPGVTDLYSDDNLQSWNTLSSYFEQEASTPEEFNLYGRCIFNVRPCITDQPTVSDKEYDQLQWYYQVYRDGELLPHGIAYFTQQSVTDKNVGTAVYTVQSYRRDGAVSAMSEPLHFDSAGIAEVVEDIKPSLTITTDGDVINIDGDFDSISIYNALGIKMADSKQIKARSIQRGIYVIVTEKDGYKASQKVAL